MFLSSCPFLSLWINFLKSHCRKWWELVQMNRDVREHGGFRNWKSSTCPELKIQVELIQNITQHTWLGLRSWKALDFFLKVRAREEFYDKGEIQAKGHWCSCKLASLRERKELGREWEKARDWEKERLKIRAIKESMLCWGPPFKEAVESNSILKFHSLNQKKM